MIESSSNLQHNIQGEVIIQEESLTSFSDYKIKPRALILKANEKDLKEIKKIIETQFPKVDLIYITTGSATSILHVTKSMPLETENLSNAFY